MPSDAIRIYERSYDFAWLGVLARAKPLADMTYSNSDRGFAQLKDEERFAFVDLMRQNKIDGWQGPAGPFVYLVLRSDAVDVVYGTMEGYAELGIPYMPHIAPEKRW